MKKNSLIILISVCALSCVRAATPIKNLTITSDSQQTGGTFTIQTGVTWTAAAGSTVNLSAGTLTLGTGQVGWAKVNKTGSSLADLATRSASDLSSGTLAIARGGTGTGTAPGNGKLLIGKTDGSYAVANLTAGSNVTITNADGAITIASTGGGGGGSLATLSDVTITSPTNGQGLIYDSGTSKWINSSGAALPSWLALSPDAPPTSPNAKDDEFSSSATLPGGGSALWNWDNQGSSTATITSDVLQLAAPTNSGDSMRTLYQAAPATPWTITTRVYIASVTGTNYFFAGLTALESSTGKRVTLWVGYDTGNKVEVFKMTNATTVSSVPLSNDWPPRWAYLRLADDGTNLKAFYSQDGITYVQCWSEARTTFMTGGANRIGVAVNLNNTTFSATGSFQWFRVN
jgi:hypothetical protein